MTDQRLTPAWSEGWKAVWRERTSLTVVLAMTLLNRVAAMVLPASSKLVIDEVIGRHRPELLFPIAVVLTGAMAIEAATAFTLCRLGAMVSQRVITRLRRDLQGHLLRLPATFFDDARNGALVSRIMADPEMVRDVLGPGVIQLVSAALTMAVALVVLITIDMPLTLVVLSVLSVFLLILKRGFTGLYITFLRATELTGEIAGRLAEVLGGIRVVKTHRAERREAYAFTRESHRLLRCYDRAFTRAAAVTGTSALAAALVSAILLVMGGHSVLTGRMTLGDLVMYIFLVGLLTTPLLQIAAIASQLGGAFAALRRVAELRASEPEDLDDRRLTPLPAVIGHVAFERVSFGYLPGRLVLHDLSFDVPAGATIALAGPNGAGKTTVAQLLLRFRRPIRGRILIDGRDLALVRGHDYRAHIGFVASDVTIFQGTVMDNIRYGRPGASLAEVRSVARVTHCEKFIAALPEGYATVVGEQGRRLSAGQRQLIAIARALLGAPRILVLDEVTAYLDADSEAEIQDALRTLRRDRTIFVIAHRFSTIRDADQILFLEGGVIVERGTHEALLAQKGRYWRLYRARERHPAASSDCRGRVA